MAAKRKEEDDLFCQSATPGKCEERRAQTRGSLIELQAQEFQELEDDQRKFEALDCKSLTLWPQSMFRDECWRRRTENARRAKEDAQRALQEFERDREEERTSPDPTRRCYALLWDKPELRALPDKFLTSTPTVVMLADPGRPTEAERAAISAYVDAVDDCCLLGQSWRQRNYPAALNALLIQQWTRQKALIAQLYGGKITYGDFANAQSADDAKFQAEFAELAQKIQAEQAQRRQAQRQYEQQQSQAEQAIRAQEQAAQAQLLMQMMQNNVNNAQQQAIQRQQQIDLFRPTLQRPPMHTNCYMIGNQMNCTTQ